MKGHTYVTNKRIAGAVAAVATAATAALLIGVTPAVADEGDAVESAYAFAASGLLDIDPISFVESTDGELVQDELIGLGERTDDAEAAGIFLGVLNAEAEEGRAQASVTRVELLEILRADLVRTWCDGDDAGLELVTGTLLGEELPRFPVGSETIDVSPLIQISFNNQSRDTDGTLNVTGIEIHVLPGADDDVDERVTREDVGLLNSLLGENLPLDLLTENQVVDALGLTSDEALQTIVIGSATCPDRGDDGDDHGDDGDNGDHNDDDGDDGDDDGKDDDGDDAAPAPAIVEADLPVTG
jgi:hypothetical protein